MKENKKQIVTVIIIFLILVTIGIAYMTYMLNRIEANASNSIKTIVKNDSEKEIESRVEIVEEKKSNRIVNILNCIIVFLVAIFIVLCGMIGYQLFF